MPSTAWWLGFVAIVALAGAGCATSDSPSAQPASVQTPERTSLDCLNIARRVRQDYAGRPTVAIDQDAYQRCLAERRQPDQPPR